MQREEHTAPAAVRNCSAVEICGQFAERPGKKKTPTGLLAAGVPDFRCREARPDVPSLPADG